MSLRAAFRFGGSIGGTGAPQALLVYSATDEVAAIGLPLVRQPSVFLHDIYGMPLAGRTIRWIVLSGAGTLVSATSQTSTRGVAICPTWTLGSSLVAQQQLRAELDGVPNLSVIFTVAPALGAGAIVVESGNNQSRDGAGVFAAPVTVRVTSATGEALAGIDVVFSVTLGAASLSASTTLTNASGIASAIVTATGTGAIGIRAQVVAAPLLIADFGLSVIVVQPTSIAAPGITIDAQSRIVFTSATIGVTYRYHFSDDLPTDTAGTVNNGAPIVRTTTTPVRVVAYKNGLTTSTVTSAQFNYAAQGARTGLWGPRGNYGALPAAIQTSLTSWVPGSQNNTMSWNAIPAIDIPLNSTGSQNIAQYLANYNTLTDTITMTAGATPTTTFDGTSLRWTNATPVTGYTNHAWSATRGITTPVNPPTAALPVMFVHSESAISEVFAAIPLPKGALPVGQSMTTAAFSQTQIDISATYSDGSAAHVLVSGYMVSPLAPNVDVQAPFVLGTAITGTAITQAQLQASMPQTLTVAWGAESFTPNFGSPVETRRSGPLVSEFVYRRQGTTNNRKVVDFILRRCSTGRVSGMILLANAGRESYVASITDNITITYGTTVLWQSPAGFAATPQNGFFFRFAPDNKTDAFMRPADVNYFQDNKLWMNYAVTASEGLIAGSAASAASYSPLDTSNWYVSSWGGGGELPTIGLYPTHDTIAMTTTDVRAWKAMRVMNDRALGIPFHFRDESRGGEALDITHYPNGWLGDATFDRVPIGADFAVKPFTHQGRMCVLAYAFSGDYHYLQHMRSIAAVNMINNHVATRQGADLLLIESETRGCAWMFATNAMIATLLPDNDTRKAVILGSLGRTAKYFEDNYVKPIGAHYNGIKYITRDIDYDAGASNGGGQSALWMYHYLIIAVCYAYDINCPVDKVLAGHLNSLTELRRWMLEGVADSINAHPHAFKYLSYRFRPTPEAKGGTPGNSSGRINTNDETAGAKLGYLPLGGQYFHASWANLYSEVHRAITASPDPIDATKTIITAGAPYDLTPLGNQFVEWNGSGDQRNPQNFRVVGGFQALYAEYMSTCVEWMAEANVAGAEAAYQRYISQTNYASWKASAAGSGGGIKWATKNRNAL